MKQAETIYRPSLDKAVTEEAIEMVKATFVKELSKTLSLKKVSAPLVVLRGTGINDDLNGTERAVKFPIKDMEERIGEVVHSLAKWKRLRLKEFVIEAEKGILTDMRALRPDEEMSAIHSINVDQWDWEKHILAEHRTLDYLRKTVNGIYSALKKTEKKVFEAFPEITPVLPEKITFIHAQELLDKYPNLSPKERENEIARLYGAIFIIGIGGKLSSGEAHDGRAPDYDDWSSTNEDGFTGLNGDIIVWNPILQKAFELSSMGIRVSKESLERQLSLSGCEDRKSLYFHNELLSGNLTESIGGGIGQSRVCMFLLRKKHIGEVQVGIWPEKIRTACLLDGIQLL